MTLPSLHGHYLASSLLRSSPPLAGASYARLALLRYAGGLGMSVPPGYTGVRRETGKE
jgi:hypothetical protein